MGTRSLTIVYEQSTDNMPIPLVNMYRQYDGYPSGHGLELAEFLKDRVVVNGFGAESDKISNGMGCLAASMIANFKATTGGFYIEPIAARNCGQDFEYHVYPDRVEIVSCSGDTIFSGDWNEFMAYCQGTDE